jgi:hypothetical protein
MRFGIAHWPRVDRRPPIALVEGLLALALLVVAVWIARLFGFFGGPVSI